MPPTAAAYHSDVLLLQLALAGASAAQDERRNRFTLRSCRVARAAYESTGPRSRCRCRGRIHPLLFGLIGCSSVFVTKCATLIYVASR
jgi:hypothetical protein